MKFLSVALGGALGALGRYLISFLPVRTEFPILTLLTNIAGAVMIGFIVGLIGSKNELSENAALFWKTGVCGGFQRRIKEWDVYILSDTVRLFGT